MNTPKNDNNDDQLPPEVVNIVNNLFARSSDLLSSPPNSGKQTASSDTPDVPTDSEADASRARAQPGKFFPQVIPVAPSAAALGHLGHMKGIVPNLAPPTDGESLHAILARGEHPSLSELMDRAGVDPEVLHAVETDFPELFGLPHPDADKVAAMETDDLSTFDGPIHIEGGFGNDAPSGGATGDAASIEASSLPRSEKDKLLDEVRSGKMKNVRVIEFDEVRGQNGLLRHDFREMLEGKMREAHMPQVVIDALLAKFDNDLAAGRVKLAPKPDAATDTAPQPDDPVSDAFGFKTSITRGTLVKDGAVTHTVHVEGSATDNPGLKINSADFDNEGLVGIISALASIVATFAGNMPRTQASALLDHLELRRDEFLKGLDLPGDSESKRAENRLALDKAYALARAGVTISDAECTKGRPAIIDPQPCTINSLLVLLDISGLIEKHGAITDANQSDCIDSLCAAIELHNLASGISCKPADIDRKRRREAVTLYVKKRRELGGAVTFDGEGKCHRLPDDNEDDADTQAKPFSFDTFDTGPTHKKH